MTRLIDADKFIERMKPYIEKYGAKEFPYNIVHDAFVYEVEQEPTVEAIPIEWIKKLIEEDRECAEKAKAEKNEKVFRFYKRMEICISQMLFDWEDENGKYEEFEGEIWQD